MSTQEETPHVLSLAETVELLGANPPRDIGAVTLDPLGLQMLAHKMVEALKPQKEDHD